MVDSGAQYTVLPEEAWKELGLKSSRRLTFVLADGTEIERDVSECLLRYEEYEAHTPVVLGQAEKGLGIRAHGLKQNNTVYS